MASHLELIEFKPFRKGSTLRGFATVRIGRSMLVHGITVHRTDQGKSWAYPPGRARLDSSGMPIRRDGKVVYDETISFGERAGMEAFSSSVVDLVSQAHPQAMA